MKDRIFYLLESEGIKLHSAIRLKSCRVQKPYLLEREGIGDGSAVIFAIPYLSRKAVSDESRNISIYAVARDYHGFFRLLSERILPILRTEFPNNKFRLFSDNSPIDERDAAARTGLGIFGSNGLLITEKYSSLVFLAEIITDADLGEDLVEARHCENCGLCKKSCPGNCFSENYGECLSALTQKKGPLTDAEAEQIKKHKIVWGCDICQEVCPHTVKAISSGTAFSDVPYFNQQLTTHLTVQMLENMSDDEFKSRAYSWRGKDTILRNLKIKGEEKT